MNELLNILLTNINNIGDFKINDISLDIYCKNLNKNEFKNCEIHGTIFFDTDFINIFDKIKDVVTNKIIEYLNKYNYNNIDVKHISMFKRYDKSKQKNHFQLCFYIIGDKN